MVVIRLARGGSKKNPFYHIVVTDKRSPRDGRFIECVGYYNPMARGQNIQLQIEKDRITHWFNQGAQTSLRVQYLIKKLKKSPEKGAQKSTMYKSEFNVCKLNKQKKFEKKVQNAVTEKLKAEKTKEALPVGVDLIAEEKEKA